MNVPLAQRVRDALADTPALPHPGGGDTLGRWRALAAFAAQDVCLVKVLEAHYDALGILAELGQGAPPAGSVWAVWAAEPPTARVAFRRQARDGTLHGCKAWCSGADLVTHALVTAHVGDERVLVAVDLQDAGHSPAATAWPAVGMSRVVSGELAFEGMRAREVAGANRYVERAGFWHGGAGIAACWYGAACAIAEPLLRSPHIARNPHAAAHLGAVHQQLAACRALLRQLANDIDAAPHDGRQLQVTALRSFVERACTEVIDRVGRALGPTLLCTDAAHAARCADLAVFIRQSHAERDWQGIGEALPQETSPWAL